MPGINSLCGSYPTCFAKGCGWLAQDPNPLNLNSVTERACTAGRSPHSLYKPRGRGQGALADVSSGVWVPRLLWGCRPPTGQMMWSQKSEGEFCLGHGRKFNSMCPPTLLSWRWETRQQAGLPEGCSVPGMRQLTHLSQTRWRTQDPAEPGPPWYSLGLCCSCNFPGTPHTQLLVQAGRSPTVPGCSRLLPSLVPPPGNSAGPLPPIPHTPCLAPTPSHTGNPGMEGLPGHAQPQPQAPNSVTTGGFT